MRCADRRRQGRGRAPRAAGAAAAGRALLAAGCLAAGRSPAAEPEPAAVAFGPYFIGYETEPAMDYGGRLLSTLDTGLSDPFVRLLHRAPAAALAIEVPLAIGISTLQHEVFGHGSRAREYGLDPSYGFGLDFSAYTTINRDPQTVEQIVVTSAGGVEADGILADRILRDLCRPGQAPAALIPLAFLGKLDLTMYALVTSDPAKAPDPAAGTSFADEYDEGNDIALYLVGRQALRRGAVSPVALWERDYRVDFSDALLHENWQDVRDAAAWNMADPLLWSSLFFYVRDHAIRGERFITPPGLPLTPGLAVNVGTRAALGPGSVSRFLDLYWLTPTVAGRLYGRELRGSADSAFGVGGGVYGVPVGAGWRLSACADRWAEPAGPEHPPRDSSWNAAVEITGAVAGPCAVSVKAGYKTAGFLPGTPMDAGAYFGAGCAVAF